MDVSKLNLDLSNVDELSEEEAYLLYEEALDSWYEHFGDIEKLMDRYKDQYAVGFGLVDGGHWGVDHHDLLWRYWLYEENGGIKECFVWHPDRNEWEGIWGAGA